MIGLLVSCAGLTLSLAERSQELNSPTVTSVETRILPPKCEVPCPQPHERPVPRADLSKLLVRL